MALQIRDTTWYRNANLKAYYPFFNTGSGYTTDRSGNSHDLTEIGDPAYVVTGSKVGFARATYLDGDDGFSITDHADLKPTGNWSIGCWVKSTTSGAAVRIFESYSKNTKVAGISLRIGSSGQANIVSGNNTGTISHTNYASVTDLKPEVNCFDGSWHQIVATWDGSYVRIYADGVERNNEAWANAPVYAATNYVRVGCGNDTGTNESFLTGSLDDVFLLNGTALSAVQVKRIYDGKKGSGLLPFFTHWKNN